jgi:hypothetical protein
VPIPNSLSAQIFPPCASTRYFAMDKSQPHPARVAGFVEAVEDVRQIGRVDPRSAILDKDHSSFRSLLIPPLRSLSPPAWSVAQCVREQVRQHLADAQRIDINRIVRPASDKSILDRLFLCLRLKA